jgi:hypothetical protein
LQKKYRVYSRVMSVTHFIIRVVIEIITRSLSITLLNKMTIKKSYIFLTEGKLQIVYIVFIKF